LVIPLENGDTLHFKGVAKKQAGQLQTMLIHRCCAFIKVFYQHLEPDLEQAYQQARILFSGQRYIRYAVAQLWFTNHQHLSKGTQRQDIHDFLSPEAGQYLKTIQPLLSQGYGFVLSMITCSVY
jgi:DNA helicase-4